MLIFKSIDNIPKDDCGYSVAIGNFDGMHLGHQSVIDIARKKMPIVLKLNTFIIYTNNNSSKP